MKRLILALVLFMTSCAPGLPGASWCYEFDFTSSSYGFTVDQGVWTPGAGFTPNAQGRLTITYTHSQPVTPTGILIDAYRADTNIRLPIQVQGSASIFGIDVPEMMSMVPADVDSERFVLAPGTGAGTSDQLLITGWVSRTVIINKMQVRGNGSNPFPSSNCSTDTIGTVADTPGVQVPGADLLDALQDANDSLGELSGPLTSPEGAPLLPNINMNQVFGYAKWLLSPTAAQELLGPFAPIVSHTGILIGLMIAMIVVYIVIFALVYLISWVVWVFKLILMIIQAVASVADSLIGGVVKGVVKFIGVLR